MRLHSFERRYNHDYNTSHLYYDDDVDVRYDVSCFGSLCSQIVLIDQMRGGA